MPADYAAAKAYRDELNRKGVHYGEADRAVDAKFGAGTAKVINPHKPGGAAKVAGTVGDVGKIASPLLTFIPGVGPIAAGALGAGLGALGTLNDQGGPTLGNVAKGAATGAAVGGLGGYGLEKYGGKLPGGAGGGAGALSQVWDFVKKNPQLAIGGSLAAMNALQGARQGARAEDRAAQDYALRAPFREGLTGAIKPPPEPRDYTDAFTDLGNPFARSRVARALR